MEILLNKNFIHKDGLVYKTGNRYRMFMKIIALLISGIFLFQQLTIAQQPVIPNVEIKDIRADTIDPDQFSLPRDIAITKDLKDSKSDKLIINIKDVHDNYGAQVSIAEVLENLLVNYDIRFVGIEGSEGYIDTSFISDFPDEEAKKLTADHLMRQGKISAGEFFTALSETPIYLYGIDDSELYLKNYYSFLNLLEYKKQNLGLVDILKRSLLNLQEYLFSEDLMRINGNSILNGDTEKGFTKRWFAIKQIGEVHRIELNDCPNIISLMKAVELEKKIDYDATNVERDELLDLLTKKVQREKLEKLVIKSLAFKLGRISKSQFYTYLVILARNENVDKYRYSNLEQFCEYVTLYESIDIALLIDEIEAYAVWNKVFTVRMANNMILESKGVLDTGMGIRVVDEGGLGFSAYAHSCVIEKLASHSQVLAITVMVPNSLGPAELLLHYGLDAQKKHYLPRLADGRDIPCFALTEPEAGSDAGAIQSDGVVFKNEKGETKIRLNFEKRYITLSSIATVIGLAFVLKDPEGILGEKKEWGITCALVDAKSKGVDQSKRHDPLNVPFVNAPLIGKDVIIGIDDIIGGNDGLGQGWKMLMESLAVGRGISLPSTSTGGSKLATYVASTYAVSRLPMSYPRPGNIFSTGCGKAVMAKWPGWRDRGRSESTLPGSCLTFSRSSCWALTTISRMPGSRKPRRQGDAEGNRPR